MASQHSLFQQAIERTQDAAKSHGSLGSTLIVTNEEHRFLALDQLRELRDIQATLLLEPSGRNTAPALTLAALCALEQGDDPILLITPADQTIQNQLAFGKAHAISSSDCANRCDCYFRYYPKRTRNGLWVH